MSDLDERFGLKSSLEIFRRFIINAIKSHLTL